MGYKKECIEMAQIESSTQKYEYALLYMMSSLDLKKDCAPSEVAWDECMEARFFNATEELHVYENDGVLVAVKVQDDGEENTNVKKFELNQKYLTVGKTLVVKEYLSYDEDGQLQIALTRLQGIE